MKERHQCQDKSGSHTRGFVAAVQQWVLGATGFRTPNDSNFFLPKGSPGARDKNPNANTA